ncbi:hypothetical protein [Neptuniibacter sp.]|uniref:hypothetical protein n=1 Tax=Neptuniibacter sp. TaxID=1962643 RepID=UPI00261DFF7D|nr:hypothetical protein [Neptuniibacter sp.]MCP4598617.1 hypothetical protein [Neptuniibacter sp.]
MNITPEEFEEGISNTRINSAVVCAARAVVYAGLSFDEAAEKYDVKTKSVENAVTRAKEEADKQEGIKRLTVHVPAESLSSIRGALKSFGCKVAKK